MAAYRAPNGNLVDAVLEVVPVISPIVGIDANGEPEYELGAHQKVDWDSQMPVKREGKFVFLCDDGEEFTFDQLTIVTEESADAAES